jgi:hypothetical protein
MTSREFCYWLQGYFEILGNETKTNPAKPRVALDANQTECVQRHLSMVFKHEIDPSYPNAQALSAIHMPNPHPPYDEPIMRC